MEEQLKKKTEESIKKILDDGITTNNLEYLYKLSKINHIAKEDSEMYGNYGNYGTYRERWYGRDEYGARRRDSRGRYMGHEHLDRIADSYGRYSENKERYGANEDTKRNLKYMLESMEDFVKMLMQEAQSQEEIEMIRQTTRRVSEM